MLFKNYIHILLIKTQKYSLGGDHQFGKLGMDWKVSFSSASENRPDERYVRYEQKGVPISSLDISNPRFPSFVYAGNDWNDVSQFGYKKTEQAFKGTEETNTRLLAKDNYFIAYRGIGLSKEAIDVYAKKQAN